MLHGLLHATALHDAASQGRYSQLKGEPNTVVVVYFAGTLLKKLFSY